MAMPKSSSCFAVQIVKPKLDDEGMQFGLSSVVHVPGIEAQIRNQRSQPRGYMRGFVAGRRLKNVCCASVAASGLCFIATKKHKGLKVIFELFVRLLVNFGWLEFFSVCAGLGFERAEIA